MNFINSEFTFAAIQMKVGSDKTVNIQNARDNIVTAAKNGAQVVSLPECFTGPYGTQYFAEYSESAVDGPAHNMLSNVAKETGVYVIGGSFPEKDQDQLFNTCLVFDPTGTQIGKHRKLHLFDIDIPDKIKFVESDVLTAGASSTVVDTKFGKIGIGICYDIRFSELARLYQKLGCKMICYPGAFNLTTGPVHWELLIRSRSLDNQLFVAGICTARDPEAPYQAWGHSSIASPWGDIIATTEHDEDIVYAKIDFNRVDEVRQQIPILKQKRYDVYTAVDKV